jgi:hypothetical protein
MKPLIQLVTPERLQIREGGGCISAFGLPFFAAGIFLIVAVAGVIPMNNASELPWFSGPLIALMGLAFTAVGGTLVFGRSWTTIDRAERVVIKQWGLLTPLRERVSPLYGFTAVRFGFIEGDSDSADRFPVTLKAQSGPDLPVCTPTDYAQAREWAKAIAQHLELEFEDATTSNVVKLKGGDIDASLQDRVRRDGGPGDRAVRPPDARSEVTREFDRVTIVIPNRRLHWVVPVAGLIPLAIPLMIGPPLATFFRQSGTPGPVGWIFLGFLTLFFGVLPATITVGSFLRSRRGATIVEASTAGVRVQERGIWKTLTTARLEGPDILDIDYGSRESLVAAARHQAEQQVLQTHPSAPTTVSPRVDRLVRGLARFAKSKGVTIKTRTGLTTFGAGLDEEEVRWLHSELRRALHDG